MPADDKAVLKRQLERMAARLLEEVEKILTEPLVMEYDNGGGQSGIRENPFYPAYEKLINTYIKTLPAAKDICGEDAEVSSLDSLSSIYLMQSANRACNDALSAVYAACLCERKLESAADMCSEASVIGADNADALILLACSCTSSAEDALVVVSYDRS